MKRLRCLLVAAPMLLLPACSRETPRPTVLRSGDASERGREAAERLGCGSCHTIPWVQGAEALVGPPLDRFGSRSYVAGVLPNTRENLVRWIKDPPGVDKLTAMPNLRVNEQDARDLAEFLSGLR